MLKKLTLSRRRGRGSTKKDKAEGVKMVLNGLTSTVNGPFSKLH